MATSTKAKKKTVRIASGLKRVRQDVKLNAANTALRSKFRTVIKNVQKAVLAGDKAKAADLFKTAQPVIDSIADKGIFHKNKAARHKSRLSAKIRRSQQPDSPRGGTKTQRPAVAGLCHFWAGPSVVRRWLSRAKFITKSQAMGSISRSASLTITQLTPSTLLGTQ